MKVSMYYRWLFFLFGMMLLGLGISMTIKGYRLGIGPWDVLHVGLYENFGLTIGTWSIIAGFTLISTTSLVRRRWPQFGTWLNMLLIGLFIDLFNFLLPDIHSLIGQILIFIAGIFVMGYGVGMYVSPKMGAGPRDDLMLILVQKTGFSVSTIRTAIEVIVALLGWMLGGPVGVGTVVSALLIGRIVQKSLVQCESLLKCLILKHQKDVPPVLKI
ncbi:YczE/YyaS/YitT family protein [Planococcus maitriensis]|uniref:YitT family protein n=1 Tax=Planococcus maitriensis TaxID=221799 RepID=A0A365K9I0_9BACL|nr:YitT family protein [Planococcus maitriensis]RAZ69440.1 YitT family protein [Planococcus maitriensis]